MSEKTERPTPRRQRKARLEGDSGASAYASQAVAFIVAVALLPSATRALWSHAQASLRSSASLVRAAPSAEALGAAALGHMVEVVALVLPILVAAGAAAALTQLIQTGAVVSAARLAPRLERLDPTSGLLRLFSGARLFAVVRALVAAGAVLALCYLGVRNAEPDLLHATGSVRSGAAVASRLVTDLCARAAAVGALLGVLDVLVMRQTWLRRNRMTKDEVKRELRESEGDPHVKAARDRAHRELWAQVAVAEVRRASVVVVNPAHLACALRYDPAEVGAPVVVTSGEGEVAAEIVRTARAWGVPVCRDVPVARALIDLVPGDTIPEALYEAVAEILREVGSVYKAADYC